MKKSFSRPKHCKYLETNAAVLMHFRELHAIGFPVTWQLSMLKARETATKDLCLNLALDGERNS